MKILMIAPQPFFEPRGTPISVYQRLQGLSKLGHQVDLITYPVGGDIHISGITIRRTISLPFIKEVRIGPSFTKIPLDILVFLYSLWMVSTKRYEVIHSHEEGAFIAMILSKIFHLPHLYDMHSCLPKQLQNSKYGKFTILVKLFEKLERWVIASCDVVLTIGEDLEKHVLQKFPTANHIRIENIPLYLDKPLEEKRTRKDNSSLDNNNYRLNIVYTGTFEHYQGLGLLIESARIVLEKYPEVRFVLVGGKPDQIDQWKRKVINLGLDNNLIFPGRVSMEESLEYLEMADILVSPRTEGLSIPLKIYSYLHSGKPTVATNIFAHTQILNDEIAVITDPLPEAYAGGIEKLIENVNLRLEIGQKAMSYTRQHFSEKSYLEKLDKAYLAIKYSKPISEISTRGELGETAMLFEDPELGELT
jgi:glycosyltransferase involved in cell wall biosynthesis